MKSRRMELPERWVWLVGGGILQSVMFKAIKARGLGVLVSDGNPRCHLARKADHFAHISTYDIEEHMALAQVIPVPPQAVLTVAADVGPTVSMLAEHFSRPAVSSLVAWQTRHKAIMRQKIDMAFPVWQYVYPPDNQVMSQNRLNLNDLAELEKRYWQRTCKARNVDPFPCVIKPVDNCASRGVSLARTPQDFSAALFRAWENTKQAVGALIEQYLSGPQVALDFLRVKPDEKLTWLNGAYRFFHRRDKVTGQPLFGVEAGHVNPWQPPTSVLRIAQQAADRLGVDQGPFKIDMIKDPRYGWCVLECATRLSGGFDHTHTAVLGPGKDITHIMLDWALGETPETRLALAARDWYAAIYAPLLPAGNVHEWQLDYPGLKGKRVFITHEDRVPAISDCAARPVFALGDGPTPLLALLHAARIAQGVKPVYAAKQIDW